MSADSLPISTARFAEALQSLPVDVLHLKISELRLSIVRLDYSNEQMRPFADGTEESSAEPDRDCIEAIAENKLLIDRQVERIKLVKDEFQRRGLSLNEVVEGAVKQEGEEDDTNMRTNGVRGLADATPNAAENMDARSSAWTDGSIQTGSIGMNGNLVVQGTDLGARTRINEQLRAALEERMRELERPDDSEPEGGRGGLHL